MGRIPESARRFPVLARSAAALVAITWALLVFGATVRVHGAGLSCPDWPLCFGHVVPTINFEVGLEFGHRVVAGCVSLGFAGLLVGMFRARRELPRWILGTGAFGVAVLIVQIVLGGLTVLNLLAEWTVTSHLLAGNTFCLTLLVIALGLAEAGQPVARAPIGFGRRSVAVALALLVPAQLALGGLVSSSHAGLACGTWPGCNGTVWFPTFTGLVGLQVMHRIVAYTLLGAAFANAFAYLGRGRAGRAAIALALAVTVQATIGVANVLLLLPVEVTLAHTAGAAAVVLATTWLQYEVWRSPMPAHAEAAVGRLAAAEGQ